MPLQVGYVETLRLPMTMKWIVIPWCIRHPEVPPATNHRSGDGSTPTVMLTSGIEERAVFAVSSVSPPDRGLRAWSFLFSAFVIEALIWGFPVGYGVLLLEYLRDPAWLSQKHASLLLPLIGPMASGFMYIAAPITLGLATRSEIYRRTAGWVGMLLTSTGLFTSSFVRGVGSLVVLQGTIFGLGGALLHAPAIHYTSEWFVARRGFANGVIGAGSAAGGLVLPLVFPSIINKYGIDKTVRFYAIINAGILLLVLPLLRGRLPQPRHVAPFGRGSYFSGQAQFFTSKAFWNINLAVLLQGLAYFVPLLWIPTYAASIRLDSHVVSLSLAMLNTAGLLGRLTLASLSDLINPWLIASTTLAVCAFSVFILWGVLAYSLAGLLCFSIFYGFLSGGWTSLWLRFIRTIAKDDPAATTSIYGCMMLFRGVGNILSTPVSTLLISNIDPTMPNFLTNSDELRPGGAYRGSYRNVIIYAGTSFTLAIMVVSVGGVLDAPSHRQLPDSEGHISSSGGD